MSKLDHLSKSTGVIVLRSRLNLEIVERGGERTVEIVVELRTGVVCGGLRCVGGVLGKEKYGGLYVSLGGEKA